MNAITHRDLYYNLYELQCWSKTVDTTGGALREQRQTTKPNSKNIEIAIRNGNDMNSYRHASGEGSSVADVVYLAHFIPFFRYMITLCRNIKHITIGTRNDSQTPLHKGENVNGKWQNKECYVPVLMLRDFIISHQILKVCFLLIGDFFDEFDLFGVVFYIGKGVFGRIHAFGLYQ